MFIAVSMRSMVFAMIIILASLLLVASRSNGELLVSQNQGVGSFLRSRDVESLTIELQKRGQKEKKKKALRESKLPEMTAAGSQAAAAAATLTPPKTSHAGSQRGSPNRQRSQQLSQQPPRRRISFSPAPQRQRPEADSYEELRNSKSPTLNEMLNKHYPPNFSPSGGISGPDQSPRTTSPNSASRRGVTRQQIGSIGQQSIVPPRQAQSGPAGGQRLATSDQPSRLPSEQPANFGDQLSKPFPSEKATAKIPPPTAGRFSPPRRIPQPLETGFVDGVVKIVAMHDPTAHDSMHDRYFEATKEDIARVRQKASYQASQIPSRGRISDIARPRIRKQILAKSQAKASRAEADKLYNEAYKTFSTEQPGSQEANHAFMRAIESGKYANMHTWDHVESLQAAAKGLYTGGRFAESLKFEQARHRASGRYYQRDAFANAFQTGYVSSASRLAASVMGSDDSDKRRNAVATSVQMRRKYIGQVRDYRKKYKDWQEVRGELSGSSSDESEKEFPDVPRD